MTYTGHSGSPRLVHFGPFTLQLAQHSPTPMEHARPRRVAALIEGSGFISGYSELTFFDGAHFAHIAAFKEDARMRHIRERMVAALAAHRRRYARHQLLA